MEAEVNSEMAYLTVQVNRHQTCFAAFKNPFSRTENTTCKENGKNEDVRRTRNGRNDQGVDTVLR